VSVAPTGNQNRTKREKSLNLGPSLKVITRNIVPNTIKIDQVKGIECGQGVFILWHNE